MYITKDKKIKAFEHLINIQELANNEEFDFRNYDEMASGIIETFILLGLWDEYLEFKYGRK